MRTIAIMASICVLTVSASAQDPRETSRPFNAREFIESTSPLNGGGSVTSRSLPGQGIQTITTIAQLPTIPGVRYQNIAQAPVATAENTNQSSQTTAYRQSADSGATYLYPAAYPPRVFGAVRSGTQPIITRTPTVQSPARQALQVPVAVAQPHVNNTARQTVYQVPTLGLQTQPVRVANNCNCAPQTGAANQGPSLNNQAAPNLNFQVPNVNVPQGTVQYRGPLVATSPAGTPQQSWWQPFVSGTGTYPPLVRLQNMPPGSYLGQGLIGQPTAYVDGQPVRNLLRYVFP